MAIKKWSLILWRNLAGGERIFIRGEGGPRKIDMEFAKVYFYLRRKWLFPDKGILVNHHMCACVVWGVQWSQQASKQPSKPGSQAGQPAIQLASLASQANQASQASQPASKPANRQAIKPASKQGGNGASKQTSQLASKQACHAGKPEQATTLHAGRK